MSSWRRWFAGLALATWMAGAVAADYVGRVVGVIDGDTVDLLTGSKEVYRIRLAGIDAPEKGQPFGQEAKKRLADLVYDHQVAVTATKKDRYGRLVGKVLVSGVDANLMMVRRGYAWHYKKYEGEQSMEDRLRYDHAESAARSARQGLWSEGRPTAPWDYRDARRHKGSS